MNVRGLAAIDMYGTRGSIRRRRVILVEFVTGCAAGLAVGIWSLVATGSAVGSVIGLLIVGVGLNYAPLSWYAIRFSRPGALDAEIVAVDVPTMLRRYAVWQLWVFVPLSLVVLDMRDRLAKRKAAGR
ncbi:MAG TPA: hypothetical protein VH442_06055 [Micromonosporaceae bacterium]|jgi:hypothetical protein